MLSKCDNLLCYFVFLFSEFEEYENFFEMSQIVKFKSDILPNCFLPESELKEQFCQDVQNPGRDKFRLVRSIVLEDDGNQSLFVQHLIQRVQYYEESKS